MDGTYHKFKEIMTMVELTPNDMELGEAVRSYYYANYEKQQQDPNQLTIQFPEEESLED